jgi:hypothetical protein
MTPIMVHADRLILMDQNNTIVPKGAMLMSVM